MRIIPFILLVFLAISCAKAPQTFEVKNFVALNNFKTPNDTLILEMDLSGGPFGKIVIPSQNGKDGDKTFHFTFTVKNHTEKDAALYYKIYYQNETYKHPETTASLVSKTSYNTQASENFYGSWISDTSIGFRESEIIAAHSEMAIADSFFIAGNPLNDSIYYGHHPQNPNVSFEEIEGQIQVIKNNPDWYTAVEKKAIESNRDLGDQLWEDAVWVLQNTVSDDLHNQRWQCNPRVGAYRFMLVAGTKSAIDKLPESIQDLSRVDKTYGVRLNPFYFFNYFPPSEIQVALADEVLKTYAILRPDAGMFYDGSGFREFPERNEKQCNNDDESFETAHFMQFVNATVLDSSLHNIDMKANVRGSTYSREEFENNTKTASRNIPSYVLKPSQPCENAWYDKEKNALVIQNPGNESRPYKKENAGVEGRIGFAYGKYTARIKFPEMINDHNVWNGVTCAFWLKFQSLDEWNNRNTCSDEGYVIHGKENGNYVLRPQDAYSEIDIEIVKTSRNWPSTSYGKSGKPDDYDAGADHNLIVSCTNWDLACKDAPRFGMGAKAFVHDKSRYEVHRWDRWYRALTLKTERPAEKTVGDVFLYQIDWQPDRIIWRVGAEKNSLDEVGYMDYTITKIPNNQMVPVMSQEFHYGHWWPMTPFPQGDIPYPEDPISGYLYEIVIE